MQLFQKDTFFEYGNQKMLKFMFIIADTTYRININLTCKILKFTWSTFFQKITCVYMVKVGDFPNHENALYGQR